MAIDVTFEILFLFLGGLNIRNTGAAGGDVDMNLRKQMAWDLSIKHMGDGRPGVLQCVVVCCSVLQCVAVCCSVLQYKIH